MPGMEDVAAVFLAFSYGKVFFFRFVFVCLFACLPYVGNRNPTFTNTLPRKTTTSWDSLCIEKQMTHHRIKMRVYSGDRREEGTRIKSIGSRLE